MSSPADGELETRVEIPEERNLFYLVFFIRLLTPSGFRFMMASDAIVKTCLLTFLGVSFALAQISGNLGLAMRQKSQVMILMLFVIVKFMDEQRMTAWKVRQARKKRMERARKALAVVDNVSL